jgi:hypothetical protein
VTLDLTIYDRDESTSLGTFTGQVARVGDRARTEAETRGVEITDILTAPASAAASFQRGGWIKSADGDWWQLVAAVRMPGTANPNMVKWQVNERGAV